PPKKFLEACPMLGKPLFSEIIDNWRYVALEIFQSNTAASSWRSDNALAILKEIYTYLNNMLQSDKEENKDNINSLKKFVNGLPNMGHASKNFFGGSTVPSNKGHLVQQ
ncbi:2594_t:CDS:2, partial [Racocetra fulgida]